MSFMTYLIILSITYLKAPYASTLAGFHLSFQCI